MARKSFAIFWLSQTSIDVLFQVRFVAFLYYVKCFCVLFCFFTFGKQNKTLDITFFFYFFDVLKILHIEIMLHIFFNTNIYMALLHKEVHTQSNTLTGSSECRQCVVEPEVKCQLAALCQAVGWRSTLTSVREVGRHSEGEERRLWSVTWLC